MPLIKFLREHVYNRAARSWWGRYLTESFVLKRIGRYLSYCGVAHIIFYWKPILALLVIFTLSTLINLYAVVYALKKGSLFLEADQFPTDTMTGYLLLGIFRFIFGATLLIPAYLGLPAVLSQPVTIVSFIITYSFSIPAWAFYLVIRSLENEDAG